MSLVPGVLSPGPDDDLREDRDARAASGKLTPPQPEDRKEGDPNATRPAKCNLLTRRVIDDCPGVMPVASPELDVIETYLRAVLDQLLGTTEENPQP